jgi:hypothetical protein
MIKRPENAIALVRRNQMLAFFPQNDIDHFQMPNGRSEKFLQGE